MSVDYGKEWEQKFSTQWKNTFPKNLIERIPDQYNGHKKTSENIADFYACFNSKLVYFECKETKEGTLNFAKFSQLDRMLERALLNDVKGYVVIWFRKFQAVVMVDVVEADRIRKDGRASIAYSMLKEKLYNIIEIPSVTTKVYPKCDFTVMREVI